MKAEKNCSASNWSGNSIYELLCELLDKAMANANGQWKWERERVTLTEGRLASFIFFSYLGLQCLVYHRENQGIEENIGLLFDTGNRVANGARLISGGFFCLCVCVCLYPCFIEQHKHTQELANQFCMYVRKWMLVAVFFDDGMPSSTNIHTHGLFYSFWSPNSVNLCY